MVYRMDYHSRQARTLVPAICLLLSGCVSGQAYTPPEIALPARFSEASAVAGGGSAEGAWWNTFKDAQLSAYVGQGLQENLDVLQAIERIQAARAQVVVAGAGGLPALTTSVAQTSEGGASTADVNDEPTRVTAGAGLEGKWLLDFFGLYQRSREAASADLDAAFANVDTARLALLSQIASAYIDVRYYQKRLELARQSLRSRRQTLDLVKIKLEAGAGTTLEIAQAEGLVNSTLAEIPGLEIERRRAAHRVATLLAKPAASLNPELEKPAAQPVPTARIDAGVPADLIRNRPDLRAAERRLASAVASVGVAEARLYPSITLGGNISSSVKLNGTGSSNLGWSFGPALVLPILDGGSLKAGVEISRSQAREAYLRWKQVALAAVAEVEDALAGMSRDQQIISALSRTVRSYETALQLSTASYADGASSVLDVLDAQRRVTAAQADLAQAIRQLAQDYVALNVAIGSGLSSSQPAPKA